MTTDSRQKIINCDFLFKCPQQWDRMTETGIETVRFCGECEKPVYFAQDQESLARLSREGRCVAVMQAATGDDDPDDLNLREFRPPVMTAGLPVNPDAPQIFFPEIPPQPSRPNTPGKIRTGFKWLIERIRG